MTVAAETRSNGALAISFQEVLTAAARFRWRRQSPHDAAVFRTHCRQALDSGAQDARDAGYGPDDVRLASYAVATYVDETVLEANDPRFEEWGRKPLETEMFGTRDAHEAFYRQLREVIARPDSPQAADLAEVYQLCLLLGFTGQFGTAVGERKKLLRAAGDKVRASRGPLNDLSPAWRIPAVGRGAFTRSSATMPLYDTLPETTIDLLVRQSERRLALLGAGALRSTPVLLVLGEPGTVKTSSVLHCGAAKEALAGEVYRDGNIVPTEVANFWYIRPATVIEAGAAVLPDRPRWCRLLEHLRAGTAPRAALVCFDIERFTRANAADVASHSAHYLRDHLQEYAVAVGARVPVYALFTRSDKIPGFPEFARKLTHDETARTIGATLPEFSPSGDTTATLATRLKEAHAAIYRSLALARGDVMARLTDSSQLEPAYEFPREFHKLKGLVVRFLSELCPPGNPAGPFLRGFYFSGARPIVVGEEAMPGTADHNVVTEGPSATGMFSGAEPAAREIPQPPPPTQQRRKIPQWLFLSNLFHEVILADYLK
jgi:type IV/VI secretion system ImpK/VasF family protein